MPRFASVSLSALTLLVAAGCAGAMDEGEGEHGEVRSALCALCTPPRVDAGLIDLTPDPSAATAVYRATHNSYSGGAKGSILTQLAAGVRFLELDLHDNDYASVHDYQVGHDEPGDEVQHDGVNPGSNSLEPWLQQIAAWSRAPANQGHAGIVLAFDLKDDLTDNPNRASGNFAALDVQLGRVFGADLYRADAATTAFPSSAALTGKIVCVLSGDLGTRLAYRRTVANRPAVAMNASGQVVEVHEQNHRLSYWTGTYGTDGRITWLRNGNYGTGVNASVTLADDGYVVEVHQSENNATLWYHVGRLGADGEIAWMPSRQFDTGAQPTVRFDAGGTTLREIHSNESATQNWDWHATLNRATWTLSFGSHGKTGDGRFIPSTTRSGTRMVTVLSGPVGSFGSQTLRYVTDRGVADFVRYPQRLFVEHQDAGGEEDLLDSWFYAAPADHSAFIVNARNAGRLVRGWDFDDASLATTPLASFPATNHPYDSWYLQLLTSRGAVR